MRAPRTMSTPALALIVFAACLFALPSASPGAELARLPLDDAAALGTTITADPEVSSDGAGSIKVTTRWPVVICLGEATGFEVDDTRLVYEARVRSEGLEGNAYLELWCHLPQGTFFSRGLDSTVTKTSDWKTLRALFLLKAGQKPSKVTLNLVVNGTGTVWVDDARLSTSP